jgi:hypothetical protein
MTTGPGLLQLVACGQYLQVARKRSRRSRPAAVASAVPVRAGLGVLPKFISSASFAALGSVSKPEAPNENPPLRGTTEALGPPEYPHLIPIAWR